MARKPVGSLPPMTSLPVFEAVGRHQSVTRAAAELNVTDGAVSRQIRNLEDFLGCPLFERAHRRIVFTPEGEFLWAEARKALDALREATGRISADLGARPLVVSCPRVFLQKRIMPVLGGFFARWPDVTVRFVVASPDQSMAGTDAAIVVGDCAPREGYRTEILANGDLTPVCSPAYLASAPPLRTPADLARHSLLRSAEFTRNWRSWLGEDAEAVFAGARFIDFESSGFELPAALEGLGIAIVRTTLVREEIASGQLVQPLPDHFVREHYALVFPETKLRWSSFRRLRQWLKLAFAERRNNRPDAARRPVAEAR